MPRYAAFISYRHQPADREWAKWLLEELETFRTPRSLVRQGYRSRIGRLYRDEDENPASAELSDQVDMALAASDALIVVASKDTPKSRWIDREVRRFQELGRGDRILVLLVDGDPAQSFPTALLSDPDREPIAADVRPRPSEAARLLKHLARLRLAAALLGCSFDELRQREKMRATRRAWTIGVTVAAILLGFSGATLAFSRALERAEIERQAIELKADALSDRRKAAKTFQTLPMVDWKMVGLPNVAASIVGPTARMDAVRRVKFSDSAGLPTILANWNEDGAAIGTERGSIAVVDDGIRWLIHDPECAGELFDPKRCAVTAVSALGTRLAAGTAGGTIRIVDGAAQARPIDLAISTARIDSLLWLPSDQLIAADARGSLFKWDAEGGAVALTQGGGSVATLLTRADGAILVLRVAGRVEEFWPGQQPRTIAKTDLRIRDGGFMRGELFTIEMSPLGEFEEGSHDSVIAMYRAQGRRELSFEKTWPPLPTDYSTGTQFVPGTESILIGSGTHLRYVFPIEGKIDPFDLESSAFDLVDRERIFLYRGSVLRSRNGRRTFSLDDDEMVVVDLERLRLINSVLKSPIAVKAQLCALGVGALFVIPQEVHKPC